MGAFFHRGIALAAVVSAMALYGCGGGGGGSSSNGGNPIPPINLRWTPPALYTDNTPLVPINDLDSFEIYVNESGIFTDTDTPIAFIQAVNPDTGQVTTSFNLANLSPYLSRGVLYRVSLRAVDLTGIKSDFSQSASFSF